MRIDQPPAFNSHCHSQTLAGNRWQSLAIHPQGQCKPMNRPEVFCFHTLVLQTLFPGPRHVRERGPPKGQVKPGSGAGPIPGSRARNSQPTNQLSLSLPSRQSANQRPVISILSNVLERHHRCKQTPQQSSGGFMFAQTSTSSLVPRGWIESAVLRSSHSVRVRITSC